MINFGKAFEAQFKDDWAKSFPNSFVYRLPDQQSMYHGTSKNPCDFICFAGGKLFLLECKAYKGGTFPIKNLTQYDRLKSYSDIADSVVGVVIWYYEKDKVVFVPVDEITKMIEDDKKSVNVKMLNSEEYNVVEIPSVKKRVFMTSDYKILLQQGESNK